MQTYFIWLINISFSKSSCDLLTSFPLYHVMENHYESYLLARNLLLHTSAWIIACSTSSLSSCKTLWRCLISRSDWDLSRIKRSYLRSATKTYQQLIWNWQLNQNKLKYIPWQTREVFENHFAIVSVPQQSCTKLTFSCDVPCKKINWRL